MTLRERINQLEAQHGSLRAAARATRIDHGYLCRLKKGTKREPSTATLRKLGLVRVVSYGFPLPRSKEKS